MMEEASFLLSQERTFSPFPLAVDRRRLGRRGVAKNRELWRNDANLLVSQLASMTFELLKSATTPDDVTLLVDILEKTNTVWVLAYDMNKFNELITEWKNAKKDTPVGECAEFFFLSVLRR